MPYKLSNSDYSKILKYYNQPIPKSKKMMKHNAEEILAEKLCSCIKKVSPDLTEEPKAIGVCTRTVLNRKNLVRGKFTCKDKRKIIGLMKKTKRDLVIGAKRNKTIKKR